MKIGGLKRIITLVIVALLIVILFTFGSSYTKDFSLVLQGKYDIEESYLFKTERSISKSRKYPYLDYWVDYVLYTNILDEEYSESELKWYIECESEKVEKIFYIYEYLDLDVYQYYDLKKFTQKDINPIVSKLKFITCLIRNRFYVMNYRILNEAYSLIQRHTNSFRSNNILQII